jgi:hypothetical protein
VNNELLKKLVDLYAERQLPSDVEVEMESAAAGDPRMLADMVSLRETVDMLHSDPGPSYTEESYQRILMKLYARGAAIQPKTPAPSYLQYHLPIQG